MKTTAAGQDRTGQLNRSDLAAALLLFAVTLVLRLWRLGYWHPLPDEISYGLTAQRLLANRTLVSTDITFFPPLFVYFAALLQAIGVELLHSVRLLSALAGSLLIPVAYISLRALYGRLVSLVTAAALMPLFTLSLYSRLGQVELPFLLFSVISLSLVLWGTVRDRARIFFFSGLSLGIALWVKETALGVLLSTLLFLSLTKPFRWHRIVSLIAGLLVPALPLILFAAVTKNNLLFEISSSRGYDINMQPMPLIPSAILTAANLTLNLLPRAFTPGELLIVILIGPLFILTALWTTLRRLSASLLCRYTFIFALIHLPFFTIFSRKFFYYLLPTALLLFITALAESLTLLRMRNAERIDDKPRRPAGSRLAMATLILAGLVVLYNIYADAYLYVNRGNHQTFAAAVSLVPPHTTLLSSHPDLVDYHSRQQGTELTVLPLFLPGSYRLDSARAADPNVAAVITKTSYYETLAKAHPEDWARLAESYPNRRLLLDSDWSPHYPAALHRLLGNTIRPTGTYLFTR